ncbi:MAG TPA: tetratricopeptide repeat protein [Sphingomicrobium sp.]|nr:tetratricopeptide repeat protein [Sphingomicrobium sp.]
MKLTPTAFALLLASCGLALTSPAVAQDKKTEAAAAKQPKLSTAARKEIVALQTAVNAKDAAAIPAALAAAKAKAKTQDDQYVVAQLQLKAAVDANDNAAIIAGLQAVLNSGFLPPADTLALHMNLGKLNYNAKAYDPAATAFEQVLAIDPNNLDATVMLAESRNGQGRAAEAVTLIEKAIATKTAAGQKADEAWYKRAVALAFSAKQANAPEIANKWVAAYPSPNSWRDTIRIYQTTSRREDADLIDSMRLARATGALQGENDYFRYANTLVLKGFAGEAKAVLEQGFAAKSIDRSKATFSQLYTLASTRSQGDRASLNGSVAAAKAAPDAKRAMSVGEAFFGYGDYAEAADMFRAALAKPGVDKDLANLRLGMALTQSGDKAGAAAALNAAGGEQAPVAKLWLTYLSTKA